MAPFDDLPADQKAVLQLVLRQGRTYDEIGGLLRIAPEAVRERALTALDAIGPADGGDLSADEQDAIGDYLLGQQGAAARAETRALLERSRSGRAWARGVAAELRAAGLVDEDALPEIPADEAEIEEAFDALEARERARVEQQRSSRLGGILLLAAAGLVVAALVVLGINRLGGDDDRDDSPAATQTTQTTQGTVVERQVNLRPPGGGNRPLGVGTIVSQDGTRVINVVGQDLEASAYYVLWLRRGDQAKFLGFFPPVSGSGSAKGRLQGIVEAPSDLSRYSELLVTRETTDSPKRPGRVILQGTLGR